jgi:hypothetical protein
MNQTTVTELEHNVIYVKLKQVYNTTLECDELISQIQAVYDLYRKSGGKFIFVFNTEHVNYCQPLLLKRFADWMTMKREDNEKYLQCSFVIIKSKFTRVCFDAILKIFTPSKPYVVKRSVEEVNDALYEMCK